MNELGSCGQQHPTSDDDQEYQARNGVAAERCTSQPDNRKPAIKGTYQNSYPANGPRLMNVSILASAIRIPLCFIMLLL